MRAIPTKAEALENMRVRRRKALDDLRDALISDIGHWGGAGWISIYVPDYVQSCDEEVVTNLMIEEIEATDPHWTVEYDAAFLTLS